MKTRYIIATPDNNGFLYYKDGGYSFSERLKDCKGFYSQEKAYKQLKEAKQCNKYFEVIAFKN